MKKFFSDLVESNFKVSNLPESARMFVWWCCEKGYTNESFSGFCEYVETFKLEQHEILEAFSWFDKIIDIATYWVADAEITEFLTYCNCNLVDVCMERVKLKSKVKEVFIKVVDSFLKDSKLSKPAEYFILWNYEKNFKTKSFINYCEEIRPYWLDSNKLYKNLWLLADRYLTAEDFAFSWVVKTEVKDFLVFCKNARLNELNCLQYLNPNEIIFCGKNV